MLETIKFGISAILSVILLTVQVFAQTDKKAVYSSNSNEKKKIALTFDDGPHPKNTEKILDILDKYDVSATFFIVGVNAKNYPDTLKQVAKRGHEIGNHTYSHIILKDKSKDTVNNELLSAEKEIEQITGGKTNLLRPPCGIYDNNTVNFAVENGYKVVLWNIDTHDWAHSSVESIVNSIEKNVKGGDIVLFHDYVSGKNNTKEALEIIIPKLKKQGYEFVTVSELLQNV